MNFNEDLLKKFKKVYQGPDGLLVSVKPEDIYNWFYRNTTQPVFTPEMDNVLISTLEYHGVNLQLLKISEECAELIVSIQKYLILGKNSKTNKRTKQRADIIDELADVIILMKMSEMIFNKQEIRDRIVFKVNRQKERLSFLNKCAENGRKSTNKEYKGATFDQEPD